MAMVAKISHVICLSFSVDFTSFFLANIDNVACRTRQEYKYIYYSTIQKQEAFSIHDTTTIYFSFELTNEVANREKFEY